MGETPPVSEPRPTVTRPIVTVVYAEITAPVVHAQTLPLLEEFRKQGRRVDSVAFTSPRARVMPSQIAAHKRALRALGAAIDGDPVRITHPPGDRNLGGLGRKLAKELRKRGEADAVLFCRQPRAALVGVAAREALAREPKPPFVVLDLRGIRDVEYLLTLGRTEDELSPDERSRLTAYRQQEEQACRQADAVLHVSRPMRTLVANRYGLPVEDMGVVPNHARIVADAEDLRGQARAELGLTGGELLVTYCGTLAAWQMAEESVVLVKAFQARRPDVRMMFLTPQGPQAKAAMDRVGLRRGIVRSVPQAEVPRYLAAADYGLLLRQRTAVNQVACPVKFGEYLACGVRPVLTPDIGDQSQTALDQNLGLVIGLHDAETAATRMTLDADQPASTSMEGREKRRAWARANISPARAAERVLEFLDRTTGATGATGRD